MADVSSLWPGDSDPLLWWGHLAGKLGCAPELDRPFLICLRGVRDQEVETHPMLAVPAYDDSAILLWRGGQQVFPMSSHAYQRDSKLSPDVDGDGRGDVGTIRPGRYLLRDLKAGKYPTFMLTTTSGDDHIPCYRDTNHDGIISHDEEARASTATAVLFHLGHDAPADSEHRSSIACQTAAFYWLRLMASKAAPSGLIDYVLLNAEDALPLVPEREAQANA